MFAYCHAVLLKPGVGPVRAELLRGDSHGKPIEDGNTITGNYMRASVGWQGTGEDLGMGEL